MKQRSFDDKRHDIRELQEERAAIMEHCGKLSKADSDRLSRLSEYYDSRDKKPGDSEAFEPPGHL